jgi:hypothetical protein
MTQMIHHQNLKIFDLPFVFSADHIDTPTQERSERERERERERDTHKELTKLS